MSKKLFGEISKESLKLLNSTKNRVVKQGLKSQREKINAESLYSDDINNAFAGYSEFDCIRSVDLQEAFVTRKALIRDIDLGLFIACKQKTNYQLMINGDSPYAYDCEDGCIELHHIGQGFNAPFAELTKGEHLRFGNNRLLHNVKKDSWRKDRDKFNQFQSEKQEYWKRRAKGEYTNSPNQNKKTFAEENVWQEDIILNIKDSLEKIFSECSISDLRYISNLAENNILVKEIGASSIEDFILKTSTGEDAVSCPYCKSKEFQYYGYQTTTHEDKQRYKCKNCGKVFTLFNNAIISGCNFSLMQWIRFIDCLYNGFSLNKTAQLCNISVQAAANNRMKLFYALKLLDQEVVLSGNIVIDETYITTSYKGNRGECFDLKRAPHKRGNQKNKDRTHKNKTCIVCALDDSGQSVAHISGFGFPNAEKIDAVLKNSIDAKNTTALFSDCSKTIYKYAQIIGVPIHQASFSTKYKNKKKGVWKRHYVQQINSYHQRLKNFVRGFNGVSSELLSGYMYLFAWKERHRKDDDITAYKELLGVMTKSGLYKSNKQIVEEKVIESAREIENTLVKPRLSKETEKRYRKIYELWGDGLTMDKIGAQFGISKQRVYQILQEFRKYGYAYTTNRDKAREEKNNKMLNWQNQLVEKHRIRFEENYALLQARTSWEGDLNSFYQEMYEKYKMKEQTVKNRITEAKNTIELTRTFKISDRYEYSTLEDIFNLVFSRYVELESSKALTATELYKQLAREFEYKPTMLRNIVKCMRDGTTDFHGKNKKTPVSQTTARNIAIFIDYMKWIGSRASFFEYVEEKYKIKSSTTYKILRMNYMADPKRYEITRLYC